MSILNRVFVAEMSDTASKILATATYLFIRQGYAATSMNSIALATGIQKASLYHHFPSKEAVLFACLQSGYTDHVEEMKIATTNSMLSFADRIEPMLDAVYGAIVESNAGQMATIVAETTSRFPEMAKRFNIEFMAEMQTTLAEFISAGIEAGEFDDVDLMTVDHALFGIPVNTTLCRAMFFDSELLEDRYNTETVKRHHLFVMRKLLGVLTH